MSPLNKPIILDNDVISRLFSVGALKRALEVWPKGSFYVTQRVIDEASQWAAKGQELVTILEELQTKGTISFTNIDDTSEDEVTAYANLIFTNKLGRGESASIAIAYSRGFDIATDDGCAREVCQRFYPSVHVFGTGSILNLAVQDSIMTQREANSIQADIRRLSP